MFSVLTLLFLTGCGDRCADQCAQVEQAYVAHFATCSVEIDTSPVCDQDNVATRQCELGCLQASGCLTLQRDTDHMVVRTDEHTEFWRYFGCMANCVDFEE